MNDLRPSTRNMPYSVSLVRNTLWQLAGQVLPLIVAVAVMPAIVNGLGANRVGILSVGLSLLAFQAVLGLGVDRAATKFLAELLAVNDVSERSRWFTTSLRLAIGIALIAGGILALSAPVLATGVFKVPTEIVGEAERAFLVFAAWLFLEIAAGPFSSVLMATERFAWLAGIRATSAIGTYVVLFGGSLAGWSLPNILVGGLGWRLICTVMLAVMGSKAAPWLWVHPRLDWVVAKRYFRFGGWVTVYNAITPLNMNTDRLILGILLSVGTVAYYAVPFDVLWKVSVVPGSVAIVMFPRLCKIAGAGWRESPSLCLLSLQFILLTTWPVLILVAVFSGELLRLWLGSAFEAHSAMATRVLAVGLMIGMIKPVFWSMVEAGGRPDLLAKLYLFEGIANIAAVFVLIRMFGVEGAAVSFALRSLMETALVGSMALRVARLSARNLVGRETARALVALGGFTLAVVMVKLLGSGVIQVIGVAAVLCGFVIGVWAWVWDDGERKTFLAAVMPMGELGEG